MHRLYNKLNHVKLSDQSRTFVRCTPDESIDGYELQDYLARALCRNQAQCDFGVNYTPKANRKSLTRPALQHFSQRYVIELAAPVETVKHIFSHKVLYSNCHGKTIANEVNHEQAEKFFRQHLIAIHVEIRNQRTNEWSFGYLYTKEALKSEEESMDNIGGVPLQCRLS